MSVPPPTPAREPAHQRVWLLGALLAVVTLWLYWPVSRHGFVDFDDHSYVVSNEHVRTGLTWANLGWAFTTAHTGNWHPLTWISHMADCQWFGLNPGAHHLVNVLIHAAAGVLLLLALHRMTGALWRSAAVAALFLFHPLRVESVAWVAERKDVLSGFFFMATLFAYARYVERPDRGRYLLTLAAFACGLMSKSMLVTLPFVLLLLDFWPLKRWQPVPLSAPATVRLLREKIPFLALTLVVSAVTFLTQARGEAVAPTAELPLFPRVANALVAYLRYLRKMFWPDDLAVFYPFHGWAMGQTAGAALTLVGITCLAVRFARRQPWFFTGWFWYLGMLVPVIGLVQVGLQAMADRYSYLPSVGITLLVVWGLAEALSHWRQGTSILTFLGATAVAGCMMVTARLLPAWQDTLTLFTRAAEVTRNNATAHLNIGFALDNLGRGREAVPHYLRAIEIRPMLEEAHYNLGLWFLKQGDLDRAKFHFGKARESNPRRTSTCNKLGDVCLRQGRIEEAVGFFLQSIQLDPRYLEGHHNLGVAFSKLGRLSEAVQHFTTALDIQPHAFEPRAGLGFALGRMGRLDAAERHFRVALDLRPDSAEVLKGLGGVLSARGQVAEAQKHLEHSQRLNPNDASTHLELGVILLDQGRLAEAFEHLRSAVTLTPQQPRALDRLAWALATAPDARRRNGREAVDLAGRAVQFTREQVVEPLDSLAAAYAEAGRFADAIATAEKAVRLAREQGRTELAARITGRLELYRSGKPFRLEPVQ